jgi:hypothetical protein
MPNEFNLIGENVVNSTTVNSEFIFEVPKDQQIRVQKGDVMGLRLHARAIIPFRGSSVETVRWNTNCNPAVSVGDSYVFPHQGGREYLVQAHVDTGKGNFSIIYKTKN